MSDHSPETQKERHDRLLRWAMKAKASAATAPTEEARKNFLEIAAQWEAMADAFGRDAGRGIA